MTTNLDSGLDVTSEHISVWTNLNTGATNNVYIPKKVRFITLAYILDTVALNSYSQTSWRIPYCVISNTRQKSSVYVHNIMPERMSKNQFHFYVFACSQIQKAQWAKTLGLFCFQFFSLFVCLFLENFTTLKEFMKGCME